MNKSHKEDAWNSVTMTRIERDIMSLSNVYIIILYISDSLLY